MGEHPIDLYAEARQSLKNGDTNRAAEQLSQALGSKKVTMAIRSGVKQLLDPTKLAHEVVLGLLESEATRRRHWRKQPKQ